MFPTQLFTEWLILLIIWDGIWKAIACWKAAKKSQLYWFIALFIINSAGILPIIYLSFFNKKEKVKKKK